MSERKLRSVRFDFYSKQTIAIVIVFLLFVILNACPHSGEKREFSGEFLANDSGVSHGGFEWAGSYTASLVVRGTKGDLILVFEIGLGDYLEKHKFSVSEFAEAGETISFKIEGRPATLVLVEEDNIWSRQYDNHLSANNSDDPSEQIGYLPIEPFEGYSSHYYIDLRLSPIESGTTFSPLD